MLKKLPLKGAVYAMLGINLITAAVILLTKSFLPPVVPLFYGLPYGEGQLAPTYALLAVPLGALILSFTNLIIAARTKDQFYKKALVIGGTFISSLGAITVIKIILMVGFF